MPIKYIATPIHKVLNALVLSGLTHDQARNAITEMQNHGILFREEVK